MIKGRGVRTGRRATFMMRDETIVSLPFSKYVVPDVRHGSFADIRAVMNFVSLVPDAEILERSKCRA